ncbi:MAG: hypothetical protein RL417_135 [Pseudomonadota bacterium]|jgi:hypothetical protein
MRFSALFSAVAFAAATTLSNTVLADSYPVSEQFRLLKFKGSLRLACYVQGQDLLLGRTVSSTDPSSGIPIELFENRGAAWIKRQRNVAGREIREIKLALRRASGSQRRVLQRRLKRATRAYQRVLNQTNAVLGPPCRDHHARVLGLVATPIPTATPETNEGDEITNLEENFFGQKTYDPHGLGLIPPRYDTTLLFVDSLSGSDSLNKGFTDEDAFQTVGRALQYLSSIAVNGRVNAQVYLRRGGSYSISGLGLSGQSREVPLVFGAYGELEQVRPQVAPITLGGNLSNLVFSDLLFEAPSPGSGTAFTVNGTVDSLLVQNSRISGFRHGIVIQGSGQSKDISIFRNIISDLSSSAGPSYGVKLRNISRAIVSSNVLDRIGQSASVGFTPHEESTAISISDTLHGAVVRGNQIFRSPTGIVLTSNSEVAMAHLHANAIVRSGIAGVVDARGVYIGENTVHEGTDIGSLNRGWGFDVRNASAVQVYRNVIANVMSPLVPADFAMKFSGVAQFGFYDVAGLDIYNAGDLHVGGFTWDSDKVPFSLAFKDSSIQNTVTAGANEPLITLQGLPASVLKSDFRRLRLRNASDPGQRLYRIIEEGTIIDVNQLGWWSWFNWHCTGLELRVSPSLRMQSNNWYAGFIIHQGVAHAADESNNPNRFEFDECLGGYHTGLYTAQQRVNQAKWGQYADDEGSVIAPTTYLDPERTVGEMLGGHNIPGTTLDDYIDYVTAQDRGNLDVRFVGQRLSHWLRVGFNRP